MLAFKGDIPIHQTTCSIGADLKSQESFWLLPFQRKAVDVGLRLQEFVSDPKNRDTWIIPSGSFLCADDVVTVPRVYDIQIRPRSGLALKKGITVINTPGTIDIDYRDPIKVILINLSIVPRKINKGDRIAQLVFTTALQVLPVKDIVRSGGFGSTEGK